MNRCAALTPVSVGDAGGRRQNGPLKKIPTVSLIASQWLAEDTLLNEPHDIPLYFTSLAFL